MVEPTVTLPLSQFDKMRDKDDLKEKELAELRKFKEKFYAIFKAEPFKDPTRMDAIRILVDFNILTEMLGVTEKQKNSILDIWFKNR